MQSFSFFYVTLPDSPKSAILHNYLKDEILDLILLKDQLEGNTGFLIVVLAYMILKVAIFMACYYFYETSDPGPSKDRLKVEL